MGPGDCADALSLYRELVGEERPIAGRAEYLALLSHPGTILWGAEREGRILAMATLHLLPGMTFGARPYVLIENVVTAQAARGQGLGRAVIEAALAHARAQDAYKVMLLTNRDRDALGFDQEAKHGLVQCWD